MIKKAVKTLAKLFPFTKKELVVLALSIIVLFFGPLAPVVIRFVLIILLENYLLFLMIEFTSIFGLQSYFLLISLLS